MKPEASAPVDGATEPDATDRLDSWKDVATYLKRDVSTVQRWERREGLPIHRQQHDKLGSVYAFRHELDAWRLARSRQVEQRPADSESGLDATSPSDLEPGVASSDLPSPVSRSERWRVGRLVAAGIATIVGIGLASWLLSRQIGIWSGSQRPEIRSIVVLPFENLSGDVTQEYFAAGLTEELTGRLAQLAALRVVSRTSAMSLQGRRISVPTIARELDVDAVVEGTVRQEGGRVRISIQLIHAPTDTHLWARDFEREAAATWPLQIEVAQAVADEIRVRASPEERMRLATVPTVSPAAHEEYLLGRHLLWKFIEEDRVLAIDHFNRAIRLDPKYAAPYAALAHAWWMRGVLGPLSLKEVATPARDAALAALAHDDGNPEALAALAYVQGMFDWDWRRAEATIEKAVALEPNSVDARYVYTLLLMAMGRLTDAVSQIDSATRLDPLSAQVHSTYGRVLYRAHRLDEARVRLERALLLEPRNVGIYGRLADVYEQSGRYDDALGLLDKMSTLSGPPATRFAAHRARILARAGRTNDARHLVAHVPPQDPHLAEVFAALGDHDAAFTSLFRALDERDSWLLFIKSDPIFEGLHRDPRWAAVLRRMNLGD
jgi:TolB-like protein/thioredoxin-like negative regulator of GroEL